MDIYSNILYVKENFPALSHLAHRTAVTDKYRPESCCIIGNYYSLKGLHTKASVHCVAAGGSLNYAMLILCAWTRRTRESSRWQPASRANAAVALCPDSSTVQSLAACMLSRPLTPFSAHHESVVYGAAAAHGRHVGLMLALPVQRWLLAL